MTSEFDNREREVLDGATADFRARGGHLLPRSEARYESSNGSNIFDRLGLATDANRNGEPHARNCDFVRAGDIIEEPDIETQYLVSDRLAVGGSAIVVGKPKAGKSTIAVNLALAVARGEPFLGSETVKKPVLYIALEGPRNEWKLLLRSLGVTKADDLYLFIGRTPQDAMVWLREHVSRYEPGLIVIDTLQRFTRVRDTSDYAQVSNATDALIELTRLSGAAILYVHHGGKSDKADLVDSPLGSTAIAGSVDSLFVVKRGQERRTIASVQRYGNDLDESVFEMDAISHKVTLAGSKKDADVRSAAELIAAFLNEQSEPVEEAVIREVIDIRKSIQIAALRSMVDTGRVVRFGGGRKGDPYRYEMPSGNSGSPVPSIGGDPENQNSEMGGNADNHGALAGSQESTSAPEDGNPNPRVRPAALDDAGDPFAYANDRIQTSVEPTQGELL